MSTIIGKVIMGFVSLVALWNLSKVPFYLAFNNDGNDSYGDSTGVELSINLGHWFEVSVTRLHQQLLLYTYVYSTNSCLINPIYYTIGVPQCKDAHSSYQFHPRTLHCWNHHFSNERSCNDQQILEEEVLRSILLVRHFSCYPHTPCFLDQ